MSRRSMAWACCAGALVSLATSPAEAQCGASSRWVDVAFGGARSAEFERAVLADLRAGLSRERHDVCAVDPDAATTLEAGAARIDVELVDRDTATVHVEVRGEARQSLFDRSVDLSHLPLDSRTFAVALAADELLHAAWVELDETEQSEWSGSLAAPIAGAEVAGIADPDTTSVTRTADAASPACIGARAAFEHFVAGHTQWGADVTLQVPFAPAWVIAAGVGARQGFAVKSAHGRTESRGLDVTSEVRHVLRRGAWRLGAGLGLYGAWLDLQGEATDPRAVASRFTGFALYARAVMSAAASLYGPFQIEIGAAAGAPLLGLEATDAGQAAASVSGLQLATTLALVMDL